MSQIVELVWYLLGGSGCKSTYGTSLMMKMMQETGVASGQENAGVFEEAGHRPASTRVELPIGTWSTT